MIRAHCWTWIRFGIFILLLLLCGSVAKAEQRPNVVMIISDDQAWNDYGFMGHSQIETPNLDRLASQSVIFRRGYVPVPICRPSLMSMVTGKYPFEHRTTGNDPFRRSGKDYQQDQERLIANIDRSAVLPKILAQQGYLTFQSGKWWEGNFQRGGFTHGMTRGFPQPDGRHGDDGLKIGRQGMKEVFDFIDLAVKQHKPFFVWYAPFLPHSPHTPPQELFEKYAQKVNDPPLAKYYAMCEWFDQTCGQLIDYIDEKGLGQETLIVYGCDNGWIQNPKGKNYLPRSKRSVFEGGVRTPLMYRWTGKLEPQDRPELATTLDFFATILSAAQVQTIPANSGLNLLPSMLEKQPIARQRLFGESYMHDVYDLADPEASLSFRYCIDGDWKLIVAYDGLHDGVKVGQVPEDLRTHLYNLKDDPFERVDLLEKQPEVADELGKAIQQWYPLKRLKPNLAVK